MAAPTRRCTRSSSASLAVSPALPGVDVVLGTDGRDEEVVAADLLAAAEAAGIL